MFKYKMTTAVQRQQNLGYGTEWRFHDERGEATVFAKNFEDATAKATEALPPLRSGYRYQFRMISLEEMSADY